MLSQDDGTSSSDRPAIECPKAGNVRKTRQCASIAQRPLVLFWHRLKRLQQQPRSSGSGDRQDAVGELHFDVLFIHPGQLCLDLVALVCLAHVNSRDRRPSLFAPSERRNIVKRAWERRSPETAVEIVGQTINLPAEMFKRSPGRRRRDGALFGFRQAARGPALKNLSRPKVEWGLIWRRPIRTSFRASMRSGSNVLRL